MKTTAEKLALSLAALCSVAREAAQFNDAEGFQDRILEHMDGAEEVLATCGFSSLINRS